MLRIRRRRAQGGECGLDVRWIGEMGWDKGRPASRSTSIALVKRCFEVEAAELGRAQNLSFCIAAGDCHLKRRL